MKKKKKKFTKTSDKAPPRGDVTQVTDDGVVHITKAPCSLDFSRDAKGQPKWGIKIYAERNEMAKVVAEVLEIDCLLAEKTKPQKSD